MKPEQLSESHGEPLTAPFPILHDSFTEADKRYASDPAVICLHQRGDLYSAISGSDNSEYLEWTFEQLSRASHAFAGALLTAGIRPGMRIVAFLSNCIEFHIVWRASLELNCTFAPMNPRSIGNAEEIRNVYNVVKPSMVIAEDPTIASRLVKLDSESASRLQLRLIASCSTADDLPEDWESMDSFLKPLENEKVFASVEITRKDTDVILILMTSGTTSLPKGCPHTNETLATIFRAFDYCSCWSKTRVVCGHLPPSHMFGVGSTHSALLQGVPVVHPSSFFDAGSTLRAIREKRCTDIGGVPAIMSALMNHPDFEKTDTSCLEYAIVGATSVSLENHKSFLQVLGATKVSEAYGMSEGSPTNMARYDDLKSEPPDQAASGHTTPGSKVRICDPETGKVIPRGQAGEVHIGGNIVISEYWRAEPKKDDDTFYTDDQGRWVKTGDQGVMLADGRLQIIGRYKDLIIRGGENISPKSIEEMLNREFGLTAEVCGVPDEVAGEVPVAVVKRREGQEIQEFKIKETLVKELGPSFALEAIVDLQELDLEDYPTTASGKVQKNVLREKLPEYLGTQSGPQAESQQSSKRSPKELTNLLVDLWTKLLRADEGAITAETHIDELADSLTMGRFPTLLQRESGESMRLQDVMDNVTPAAQAKFLGSATGSPQSGTMQPIPSHEGPPTMEDMIHTHEDESRVEMTIEICTKMLEPLGMKWEDVQDVLPTYSFQQRFLTRRRLQSNNHRHAWVCSGANVETARAAVEATLSHHDMLRTMAVNFDDRTPLHVVMRSGEKWYDKCITVLEKPVAKAADLESLVFNDPELDYAAFPGPLFRVVITHIEEENCAGIVYMAQHSTFDGISLVSFLEDLDNLLGNPKGQKNSNTSQFKAWVNSAYNLRSSRAAQTSVDWHVKRLAGLKSKEAALFPAQRAPEWFKGSHMGWIDPSTGKSGNRDSREGPNDSLSGAQGLASDCNLSGMRQLKKQHAIETPCILKAALAILNSRRTGQSTALFAQYQAGRTWPFLPDWQEKLMPTAMTVDGPTVEVVILLIDLNPDHLTVLQLLQHLQSEQTLLNKYAHAPFDDVINSLDKQDGEVMLDVWRRQIFNWLPSDSDSQYKHLRKIQQLSRTDVGILWNCMQMENEVVRVMPSWDDAQVTLGEAERMLEEVIEIAESLVREDSWGRKVRVVI